MMHSIRKHAGSMAMIVALVVVSTLVSAYILANQRFRLPFIAEDRVPFEMVFSTGQAVTPGQGQTVQVAGVTIGSIESVRLENGRAVVGVDVLTKHQGLVREGSRALLRPRTGLKDMYIQLLPALDNPPAEPGSRIPVANTLPDVDLHEILGQLDERTRDYVQLLAAGLATGLEDRGDDLAEVFRRYAPTARDLALVNRSVAQERQALSRTITALAEVNEGLARNPRALTELVDSSAAALGAFASEDVKLRETISELAPTLQVARTALGETRDFAEELGPATSALVPVLQELDASNPAVRRLAREGRPIVADEIRPFARAARPVVGDLRPAVTGLAGAFPELRRDLRVLNRFFNMLAFNPGGPEAPGASADREEGYLFWLAWVAHQTINLINVDDGNGPMRPIFLTGSCTTLQTFIEAEGAGAALAEVGLNLSAVFANLCGSEEGAATDLDGLLDALPPKVIEELPVDRLEQADPQAAAKVRQALREARADG